MSTKKKQTKTAVATVGRPPVDIDSYFAEIQPYLQLGLSLHKACDQADIPYRTVADYYSKDEDFRRKVDRQQQDMRVISRRKLFEAVKDTKRFGDPHKYVLDNLDEDFKKNTKVELTGEGGGPVQFVLKVDGYRNTRHVDNDASPDRGDSGPDQIQSPDMAQTVPQDDNSDQ